MSKPLVSDEFWELVQPLLPPQPPKPKGGRPRIPDRHGPKWDTVRAKDRHWLGRPTQGDGLWQWDDLLEAPQRLAPVGSLGAHPLGMP